MPSLRSRVVTAGLVLGGLAPALATGAEPTPNVPAGPAAAAAPAAADPSAPAAAPAEASPLAALLAKHDAAYADRDQAGKMAEAESALAEAEKLAPEDYGVLWRRARVGFWISDDPRLPADEKSKLGKGCWEVAERAATLHPAGVEGWFHAAGCMGNYSLGIGVLRALTQGIEGKFRDRLGKAEAADPGYNGGGIPTAWGRFYYELPWPKYDAEKSEQRLRAALKLNPRNVRAHVYLAELLYKEDRDKEARAALEEALALVPGAYDGPEERRWQARAAQLAAAKK